VRMPQGAQPHPQWEPHRISLEDLVLAYLDQRPGTPKSPLGSSEA
jgi:hypothetical protein